MSKLYETNESEEQKKKRHKARKGRFYSQLDMSIIKHDIAVKNSETKRGVTKDHANNVISVCGCGCVGCFIHIGFDNYKKD